MSDAAGDGHPNSAGAAGRPAEVTAQNDGTRFPARRWLVVLVLLGVLWRAIRFALGFPFWGDEAYLNTSILHYDYRALFDQPLEYFQIAPLAFLWLQRLMLDCFGGGEYALRTVPFIAGLASFAIFVHLSQKWLEPRAATVAIGIFAASYPIVRHAVEAKPYATDLLMSLLLTWLAASWIAAPPRLATAARLALAAAAGVWLSYPALFVAAGIGLVMLIRALGTRDARTWIAGALYSGVLLLSFSAFCLLFALRQSQRAANSWLEDYWERSFPPLTGLTDFLYWLLDVHTGRMFQYPLGGPDFASSATTLFCIAGAFALFQSRRRWLLLLLAAPVLPTFVAALLHKYPYGGSARVSLYFAPAICWLAGAGVARLAAVAAVQRYLGMILNATAAVLALICVGGAVRDLVFPYKIAEYAAARTVLQELAERTAPQHAIAIINPRERRESELDGPMFHQTLRYYLELYTGRQPHWCEGQPPPPETRFALSFQQAGLPPRRERVEQLLQPAGLTIIRAQDMEISPRWKLVLTVYELVPAAR